MVEVLGHVGEGFVAELTLVKGVCSVGLPATHREEQMKQTEKESNVHISSFSLLSWLLWCLQAFYLCMIRVISVVKPLPQSTHRYLATPECVRMCVCSDVAFLNTLPHSGHSCVPCSCTRL